MAALKKYAVTLTAALSFYADFIKGFYISSADSLLRTLTSQHVIVQPSCLDRCTGYAIFRNPSISEVPMFLVQIHRQKFKRGITIMTANIKDGNQPLIVCAKEPVPFAPIQFLPCLLLTLP